ncbi:hypothetical protein [Merismopedia glauca]|nr:hypothetical protein [Merismopedia glauca]
MLAIQRIETKEAATLATEEFMVALVAISRCIYFCCHFTYSLYLQLRAKLPGKVEFAIAIFQWLMHWFKPTTSERFAEAAENLSTTRDLNVPTSPNSEVADITPSDVTQTLEPVAQVAETIESTVEPVTCSDPEPIVVTDTDSAPKAKATRKTSTRTTTKSIKPRSTSSRKKVGS